MSTRYHRVRGVRGGGRGREGVELERQTDRHRVRDRFVCLLVWLLNVPVTC